jgi:hypothetical protein
MGAERRSEILSPGGIAGCRDQSLPDRITARTARNERIEPTDRQEPIENTDTADPIDPTESAEPIDPIESTEPLLAIERNDSSDHRDHFELPDDRSTP